MKSQCLWRDQGVLQNCPHGKRISSSLSRLFLVGLGQSFMSDWPIPKLTWVCCLVSHELLSCPTVTFVWAIYIILLWSQDWPHTAFPQRCSFCPVLRCWNSAKVSKDITHTPFSQLLSSENWPISTSSPAPWTPSSVSSIQGSTEPTIYIYLPRACLETLQGGKLGSPQESCTAHVRCIVYF